MPREALNPACAPSHRELTEAEGGTPMIPRSIDEEPQECGISCQG
jgi:hypothetical protein